MIPPAQNFPLLLKVEPTKAPQTELGKMGSLTAIKVSVGVPEGPRSNKKKKLIVCLVPDYNTKVEIVNQKPNLWLIVEGVFEVFL